MVCPVAVAPDDRRSYYQVAERLTHERKAFRPNQYANPNNPLSHYKTTGPEIWEQTAGRITHFVAGAGTCGSITGTARYLKEQNPDIKIIAADPEGSVFSGGSGSPVPRRRRRRGLLPGRLGRRTCTTRRSPYHDADSFHIARRDQPDRRHPDRRVGRSRRRRRDPGRSSTAAPDDLIVVFNPDSGRGYLSRVFDDDWMANYGFLTECDQCVGAVLEARNPSLDSLLYVNPDGNRPGRDRADAGQRHQPTPGLQEHTAVRRRRGVGRGRRTRLMEAIAGDPR